MATRSSVSCSVESAEGIGIGAFCAQLRAAAERIWRWNLGRERENRDHQVNQSNSSLTGRGSKHASRDRDPRAIIGFNRVLYRQLRQRSPSKCRPPPRSTAIHAPRGGHPSAASAPAGRQDIPSRLTGIAEGHHRLPGSYRPHQHERTQNLLDHAVACDAKMLFASTSEVYGDPEVHP